MLCNWNMHTVHHQMSLLTNTKMHCIFPCSSIMEVSYLFAEIVQHGLRCIAFCKTRKLCELVLSYTYVPWSLLLVVFNIFCSLFICIMMILSINKLNFNVDARFFRRVLLILWTLFVLIVLAILLRSLGYLFSAQSSHWCYQYDVMILNAIFKIW